MYKLKSTEIMSKTIKKGELESIQKINRMQLDIKLSIGDAVIRKAGLDDSIENLVGEFKGTLTEMKEVQDKLQKEYGDVKIDVQTGEIVEEPSAKVEEDDNKGDS